MSAATAGTRRHAEERALGQNFPLRSQQSRGKLGRHAAVDLRSRMGPRHVSDLDNRVAYDTDNQ